MLYRSHHQNLIFDQAKQSSIEVSRSERGSPSLIGKGDEEDRLNEVAAGQISNIDEGCGIPIEPFAKLQLPLKWRFWRQLSRRLLSYPIGYVLLGMACASLSCFGYSHASTIQDQIIDLSPLCQELQNASSLSAKLDIVTAHPNTKQFLKTSPALQTILQTCNDADQCSILAILAIGQGPTVFQDLDTLTDTQERLKTLLPMLAELERSYSHLGGIAGYHLAFLKLLANQSSSTVQEDVIALSFSEPKGTDCSKNTPEVRQAVRWGIENMPRIADIYPIGGAGDRLSLKDEATSQALPAAQLKFCGRTLLEGLIRDLQGREFLYYKLFDKQLVTPVAAMTSHEKDNHSHILQTCHNSSWFGRPKDSFAFFTQSLVPMLTIDGQWAMKSPLRPYLKPGGHGVIWKTALDNGIFVWLSKLQRSNALVRQINNPIASIDIGIFSLVGLGSHHHKDFGFACCPRLLSTSEGMLVLREKQLRDGYEYCISNVEYTEFDRYGIQDKPKEPGGIYSQFPANTNILYVDLAAIQKACQYCSIPGLIINMKNKEACYAGPNQTVIKQAGRLESTMQNIADWMGNRFSTPLENEQIADLKTFMTSNTRLKTTSVTKQAFDPKKSIVGTPEGCFYDLMLNYADLLANHCGMQVPPQKTPEQYLDEGPSFTALFHPALGGVYSVIAQKIRGGRLAKGAEWIMEIAEANIENLDLQGSLLIEADSPMGKKDPQGVIQYDSSQCGKCTLLNVTVRNAGQEAIDGHRAWKRQIERKEVLHIILHGNGEFYAEDVVIEGSRTYEVPDGHRLIVSQQGIQLVEQTSPSWQWKYAFDADNNIQLSL